MANAVVDDSMTMGRTKKKAAKSSGGAGAAAEQIGHNEDLLPQILLHLPTKSLIKFKVVSKQWMSLISSPRFAASHTRILHQNGFLKPSGFYAQLKLSYRSQFLPLLNSDSSDSQQQFPTLDFPNLPNINILQSCTGLLLCVSRPFIPDVDDTYFVCNPTTRKFKVITFPPPPQPPQPYFHRYAVYLAFDPLKSPHYKIVSVWFGGKRLPKKHNTTYHNFSIDIYSSETDSWEPSKIQFACHRGVTLSSHSGVYCRGAIHWYNSQIEESQYLDLEEECVKTMPMPRLVGNVGNRYFGECDGHLTLAFSYRDVRRPYKFVVYRMAEDYSGWDLIHRLDVNSKIDVLNLESEDYDCRWLFTGSYLLYCPPLGIDDNSRKVFILLPKGEFIASGFKDIGTLKGLQQPLMYRKSGAFQLFPYFHTLSCCL